MQSKPLEEEFEGLRQITNQEGLTILDTSVITGRGDYNIVYPLNTKNLRLNSTYLMNMIRLIEHKDIGVIPEVVLEFDRLRRGINTYRKDMRRYYSDGVFRPWRTPDDTTDISKKKLLKLRYGDVQEEGEFELRHRKRRYRKSKKEVPEELSALRDMVNLLNQLGRVLKRREYSIADNDPLYKPWVDFLILFGELERLFRIIPSNSNLHTDERLVASAYYSSLVHGKNTRILTRDRGIAYLMARSYAFLTTLSREFGSSLVNRLREHPVGVYLFFPGQPILIFGSTQSDGYIFRVRNLRTIKLEWSRLLDAYNKI